MSEPLTSEEIAELRRLEQAARPAPWRAEEDIANEWDVFDGRGETWVPAEPSSAKLVAAARNALPRLLDELEELRAELADEYGPPLPPPPAFQLRGNVLVRGIEHGTERVLWEEEIKPPTMGTTIQVHGEELVVKWHTFPGDMIHLDVPVRLNSPPADPPSAP